MASYSKTLSQDGSGDIEKVGVSVSRTPYIEVGEVTKPSIWQRFKPSSMRCVIEYRPHSSSVSLPACMLHLVRYSLISKSITTGLVGTLYDGLSLQSASPTILFSTLMAAIPPAALGTLGPQTGMRQIIQARCSFGLYAVGIVALFNLANTTG